MTHRTWKKPGKIRGEKGKPNVPIRVLDLIYAYQDDARENGAVIPTKITAKQLRHLAFQHDKPLLHKGRLYWGIHFLITQLGHLKRITSGHYRIVDDSEEGLS